METLSQFMAVEPKRPMQAWADDFGISRSYLSEILSGKKQPGRDTIAKINAATGGRVPPAVWFGGHVA